MADAHRPSVYHHWEANEMITLAVLRCYTSATWVQICILMNERYQGAFDPPLRPNQAQEKFKTMRRRDCPEFDEARGYGLATATQQFPLANWMDRGKSDDPRGLLGLVIQDRRAENCCRFLPALRAPRPQPAAGGNLAAGSSDADSNEAEFGSAEGDDEDSDDLLSDDVSYDLEEEADAEGETDSEHANQQVVGPAN